MINKSLGLFQLICLASTLVIPDNIISTVSKLFSFLWKIKKDTQIMMDTQIMFKTLKLSWIPRLLKKGSYNWKTIPDYYLRKSGGLNFLLKCNYDTNIEIFWPTSMNLNFSMVMIKHKTPINCNM